MPRNKGTRAVRLSALVLPCALYLMPARLTAQEEPGELFVSASTTILVIGQTVSLAVTDMKGTDLTAAATGTIYQSSNPSAAHVTEGGLVTALTVGTVTLSVVNGDVDDLSRPFLVGSVDFLIGVPGDQDADGLPDDYEVPNGLDPLDPADAGLDPDLDGLTSTQEFSLGTHPLQTDTDGDGASDGGEVEDGTDPLEFDLFLTLDASWTMTVNGQSVRVNGDGTFSLSNIAAADRFGEGGPGTAPDFKSDDFLRMVGTQATATGTRWVFSPAFQITQGTTFRIGGEERLTFSETAPPFPESLFIDSPSSVVEVGDSVQVSVTGVLLDGSLLDVTARTASTLYLTSNSSTATVDADGLVLGHAPGPVVITALNEGVAATKRMVVSQMILTTTVEGYVQLQGGTPASGAEVFLSSGRGTITGLDGSFLFQDVVVPLENTTVSVRARAMVSGQTLTAFSGALEAIPGGITDAGILVLGEVNQSALVIWDVLNDGTSLLVNALETAGFAVTLSPVSEVAYDGTNPDPRDFGVVVHLNGTTYDAPMPVAGQLALVDYVNQGGGFVHGEWNAFEIGLMLAMEDITLLLRSSGVCATTTFQTVASMSAHPVLTGIPTSFPIDGAFNVGSARFVDSDVLMTAPGIGDAVVAKEVSAGRVVGFAYAGNFITFGCVNTPFNETEILQLYVNAALWAVRALN